MDTLQNLKAFLAVAGSGSFSAAARRLGVAPSVVTKRIDQLEWAAKVALFALHPPGGADRGRRALLAARARGGGGARRGAVRDGAPAPRPRGPPAGEGPD